MSDLFRETFFGHAVPFFTGRKVFQYPEERTDFELPAGYSISDSFTTAHGDRKPSQGTYMLTSGVEEKTEGHGCAESAAGSQNSHLSEEKAQTIMPSVSADGSILVGWYSSDDPANPQNWPSKKKAFVAMQIWYTSNSDPPKASSCSDLLVASILLQFISD